MSPRATDAVDEMAIVIPETEVTDIAVERYSEFLVASNERQVPDARDGLKPVQRRILITFRDLGMKAGGDHKKSAKITGDVMGNYHPHGDMAIYDAAVNLAQEWTFRYPLVDGSGNFGSIDGDPPAANRYTEMRPQPLGDEMLRDMHDRAADIIPWTRNYTNDRDEPECLPGHFPQLLANGILLGIGTGHSAMWLPHNLNEVIDAIIGVIDDPSVKPRDLARWMKGPDFPAGGTLMGIEGYLEALETGRGRVVVRGDIAVEEDGRDVSLIVTGVPWQKDRSTIKEQIMAAGTKDKLGNAKIEGILDVIDESGSDWRTESRVVVRLRKDANPKLIAAQLYKATSLETSYTYHQNAYLNGYPAMLNMREAIDVYVAHQFDVLTRRTNYRLRLALALLEVQEAYLLADKHANELVPLARRSANKAELEKNIPTVIPQVTERQAQVIAEMPLWRFSKIDTAAVKTKIAELNIEIAEYRRLLATRQAMLDLLKVELREIRSKHGDARRTRIGDAKLASEEIKTVEELIPDEACWLVLSTTGLIARHAASVFKTAKRGGTGAPTSKNDDDPISQVLGARNRGKVWLLTSLGNLFSIKVTEIEEVARGVRGTNVRRFLSLAEGEQIVRLVVPPSSLEGKLFMATAQGKILQTKLSDYANMNAGGLKAIKIADGDRLIAAFEGPAQNIVFVTSDGYAVRFSPDAAGVPTNGRGAGGVDAVKVQPGASVVAAMPALSDDKRDLAVILSSGKGKKSRLSEYPTKGRAIKGVSTAQLGVGAKAATVVFAGIVSDEDDIFATTSIGRAVVLPASEVKRLGRDTGGVMTIGLSSSAKIDEHVSGGTVRAAEGPSAPFAPSKPAAKPKA
jgi:DNA gyrase subunit A